MELQSKSYNGHLHWEACTSSDHHSFLPFVENVCTLYIREFNEESKINPKTIT